MQKVMLTKPVLQFGRVAHKVGKRVLVRNSLLGTDGREMLLVCPIDNQNDVFAISVLDIEYVGEHINYEQK